MREAAARRRRSQGLIPTQVFSLQPFLSKPHFAQLGLEGRLELLQIGGRRAVAGLLSDQSQAAGLIQVPFGAIAVAEGYFATDNCSRAGKVIY